jgi:hypothetical protein
MDTHRVCSVAVNVWVDEGVAPLVLALNRYPQIVTLESCESGLDGQAFVSFFVPNEDDLIATVERLAEILGGADLPAVLALEWGYGVTTPGAVIRCPPDAVDAVALRLS